MSGLLVGLSSFPGAADVRYHLADDFFRWDEAKVFAIRAGRVSAAHLQ